MKKYLALIYLSLSVMSLAQFRDNVFDQEQSKVVQQHSDQELEAAAQKEQVQAFDPDAESSGEEVQSIGPGNPGDPAPIDGYVPFLLLSAFVLIGYYQIKKKKINI